MADRGLWLKAWTIMLWDNHAGNLNCQNFGRFMRLMLYTKQEGVNGVLEIEHPGRLICPLMEVEDFSELADTIEFLPGVSVERHSDEEGLLMLTIKFNNWDKYQSSIDPTNADRQRRKTPSIYR